MGRQLKGNAPEILQGQKSEGMKYVCQNKKTVHQHYDICCISFVHLELCVSGEYQLTASQNNQVSAHPFRGE